MREAGSGVFSASPPQLGMANATFDSAGKIGEKMALHKRTEITVETNEIVVVRRARFFRAWCPECGREVDMVGLSDARAVAGSGEAAQAAVQAKDWHICEGQNQTALVCLDSLLKSI